MKSIITVFGSFLFSIFLEGFTRLIIIFYHQGEFAFFGISKLPSISWTIIILVSVIAISWISGMLTVTITGFSPIKHLISLAFLFILWRLNEIVLTHDVEPTWYLFAITFSSLSGLYLAHITQKYTHVKKPVS